ncbi:MAG TPA: hypothetical protein VL576_01710 [Candidatus Paceibacterota bacterium]|nr:hypothetical protein [Candidatus Paceibacterota bacterium]
MDKMETPQENPNIRPEMNSDSENFDAHGSPRKHRELPGGTVAFLSDEEYAEEMQNQNN